MKFASRLVFVTAVIAGMAARADEVKTYPTPAIYVGSHSLSLQANGHGVPVILFQPGGEAVAQYQYAHLSFSGHLVLDVGASAHALSRYFISPKARSIPAEVVNGKLRITLDKPQYLIVKLEGEPELVIAADALEADVPAPEGQGIYNIVRGYGADARGSIQATAAIQKAIDAAANRGKGTVYVPDGVFSIGNLTLRSGVTLYLSGGAVLRAQNRREAFRKDFLKHSLDMDGTWLISTAPGSHDIAIRGRGTIDGNGTWLRGQHLLDALIMPLATRNFTVDGVIGRDAGFWAFTPTRSQQVSIENYKGFQSLEQPEDDAIDINESQNVTLHHVIAISEDDTYSTKTWGNNKEISLNWPGKPEALSNVSGDDLIAWTHCAAFKVGNGHSQSQDHVSFRDGYVYASSRAIAVYLIGGAAPASNLLFEHIDIESVQYRRDGPYWLQIVSAARNGAAGAIRNVVLRDINVRDPGTRPARIAGYSEDAGVSGVDLSDVRIRQKPIREVQDLDLQTNPFVHRLTIKGQLVLP